MDGLVQAIQRCNLQLKLDNPTEGQGNCFPNAIVQQCRRPEVKAWLKEKNPDRLFTAQQWVRKKITTFAIQSRHRTINELKIMYEAELQNVHNKSWLEYWRDMSTDGTWVDHMFVQMTAWFMELDILILTTSSLPSSPFIIIEGNINKTAGAQTGPPILVGNYTNVHYQSLLNDHHHIDKGSNKNKKTNPDQENPQYSNDFIYYQNGPTITFRIQGEGTYECPYCKQVFKSILMHINRKTCLITKSILDISEFRNQYDSFKEGFKLEMGRKRKQKSRSNQIEKKGLEQVRNEEAKRKEKSKSNQIAKKGLAQVRNEETKRKEKSRSNQIEKKGLEHVRKESNKSTLRSRDKSIVEKGPVQTRKLENERKLESRQRKIQEYPEMALNAEKK